MTSATLTNTLQGTWTVDPIHSSAEFSVAYMGASKFTSSFSEIEATLTTQGDLSLQGKVPVASLNIGLAPFKEHLLSEEFFAADRAPYIEFSSDTIRIEGEKVTVHGTLSIRGTELPITGTGDFQAPFEDPMGNQRIGLNLATTIDRTAYGITWNKNLPNGKPSLANEVELRIQLYFVQQETSEV